MRRLIRIPDELFRKLLHCILLGSLLVYVQGFAVWYHAALSCLLFAAVYAWGFGDASAALIGKRVKHNVYAETREEVEV